MWPYGGQYNPAKTDAPNDEKNWVHMQRFVVNKVHRETVVYYALCKYFIIIIKTFRKKGKKG